MQFFVLLSLLVELFVSTKAAKPRSINVALDTVFEFDKPSDVDFINQVQGILNKVKSKIKGNPKQDDNEYTMRVKQYKFTNFLEDLIDTVLSFNDKDLIEIVQIVKNEIQENKHGDTLQENVRRFLSNELNLIKAKPVRTIRKDLDKLLRKLQNPKKEKNINIFLGFINTLYKRDTQEKLSNFIRKLKIFRQRSRKSGQLQHTVRKAVQLIIIDYFSNLSKDTKRKVETRLKDYLLDDFSTVHNVQPHRITIEPELVIHNSEDTNTEETIEIEEKGFKPHRNNYIPYLNQDRSEDTEVSTKTLAKNEIVNVKQKKVGDEEEISIEKDTIKESHVTSEERYTNSKYSTDTTRQITHPKPKRSHNIKNKSRNVTTESSTKTYVTNNFLNVKHKNTYYNEEDGISIEKVTKKESDDANSKEKYRKTKYIMAKPSQTTYSKPRRIRTKKSKRRSKNANIKYTKGKLTHITLYPGNIKIERRNFRDLKEDKTNKAKDKRTLDDSTLTSISYGAEINVSLKNNKIKFAYDDNKDNVRKNALMKVRAFRQKLMESRTIGDNKDLSEYHSEDLSIKKKVITTPKPSVAYFGNLFKSKGVSVDESDSRQFDDSDIGHTHKVTEYVKKIDDEIETRNIENINNVTTIVTRKNLDEKQWDFRANYENNDFQESADNRLSKQVAEDKSAEKLKTVGKIKENVFLSTSRYKPKPRQDTYIADNNSGSKFKTIEITTDSYDRLAEEHDIEENISNKNMETSEISTKNYEELEEYNFVESKPERNITTLEITTRDYFSNNRGYRRTKHPKIIDKVRLEITTNEINAIKKSNTDMEIKATLTSNMDYNMPPVTLDTKADNIINKINKSIVHKIRSGHNLRKSTKATKKIVENQSTHRKIISKQFTEKVQELSTKFTEAGMHINLGLDMQGKHDTTKTQSEFKSGTQMVNIRKQTNLNQKNSTNSYSKDIKPINYKTNGSRRQQDINSKSRTVVIKDRESDANFKENKISTTAVNSLDINKVTKNKDNKHNSIKEKDLRKNLKITPKTVFKNELLDAEFEEEIKNSEKRPIPIDIEKYIKNPEVADVGDEKKKKEIEQKMKEELSNLFTSPSTIATTAAAFTDIFEALDDEFGLGPLK